MKSYEICCLTFPKRASGDVVVLAVVVPVMEVVTEDVVVAEVSVLTDSRFLRRFLRPGHSCSCCGPKARKL